VPIPDLRTLVDLALWASAIGQAILLWMQLRALAEYKHRSFGILAVGTTLGLAASIVLLLVVLAPSALPSPRKFYAAALAVSVAQIPVAIWGVAWLFRSYGQLRRKEQFVLPDKSLEQTREG